MSVRYSVVIPVYNSEASVGEVVRQLRAFFAEAGHSYEIVLVNDGSRDDSWNIISGLARDHDEVVAIDLLRNSGQHNANMCGFRQASGDFVITMDDDLQNPPSEIARLIEAADQGHDLVLGRFESKKHSLTRRLGSWAVGWIMRKTFNIERDLVLTNFRIVRRDVVDRVCRDQSVQPHVPGLVLKHSVRRCNVLVRHEERAHGESTYTMRKLLRLVATLLFNHSTIPLRYGAMIGFVIAGLSFLLGVYYLVRAIVTGTSAPGWPTLVVLVSFFNGFLIVLVAIVGEYVLRVLREQRAVQGYEVREVVQ